MEVFDRTSVSARSKLGFKFTPTYGVDSRFRIQRCKYRGIFRNQHALKFSYEVILNLAILGFNLREVFDSRFYHALTRGTQARMVVPSPGAEDTSTSPPAD